MFRHGNAFANYGDLTSHLASHSETVPNVAPPSVVNCSSTVRFIATRFAIAMFTIYGNLSASLITTT
jgi:hypothetical protein